MNVKECRVGMKTQLRLYGTKVVAQATCVSIPSHKLFAVFRFESGIRQTEYLEDDTRYAYRCMITQTTSVRDDETQVERQEPDGSRPENSEKIREALRENKVTMSSLCARLGHSSSYLTGRIKRDNISDREAERWLALIGEIKAESKNQGPNQSEPYYEIKKALFDEDLTLTRFSILMGRSRAWLAKKLKDGMEPDEQNDIIWEIHRVGREMARNRG